MELRQYLKILQINLVLILALSVLGAAIAFIFARSMPEGFQESQTFFVSSKSKTHENLADYYAQEKARNFTDTAVAILDSADFRQELGTGGQINIKKIAPQVVRITTHAPDGQSTKDLMERTVSSFNTKLAALSQDQSQLELISLGTPPEPAHLIVNKKVFALSGIVLGFTFAILTLSLKTYFKL